MVSSYLIIVIAILCFRIDVATNDKRKDIADLKNEKLYDFYQRRLGKLPGQRKVLKILLIVTTILAVFETFVEGAFWTLVIVVFDIAVPLRQAAKRKNQKNLTDHLNQECTKLGYVDCSKWEEMLPQFAKLKYYDTTFFETVVDFTIESQETHIDNDRDFRWLRPMLDYLVRNIGADQKELESIQNEELQYTHYIKDDYLIFAYMGILCGKADSNEGQSFLSYGSFVKTYYQPNVEGALNFRREYCKEHGVSDEQPFVRQKYESKKKYKETNKISFLDGFAIKQQDMFYYTASDKLKATVVGSTEIHDSSEEISMDDLGLDELEI